ncbi:MAG TPA: penicillin-binding protein 2 [Termitinemataceae bacterium]|nr:penicillin-binding protein 2 [Termitinemataceae bacterium]HOM22373.1 penicillin-binding protein 2 [Termitinemataceae bacterium]HPP99627.1 penicillin-binding protein 2 [Termitinemataceae bacterium]
MALPFNIKAERPIKRIEVLKYLFITIFSLYALRLFFIQGILSELYRQQAATITRRVITIPAQRGEIYDRNYNQPIVLNVDSFSVSIIPAEIPKGTFQQVAERVASIMGISTDVINTKIPPSYYHLYQPIEIATNVSYEAIVALAEHADELPGVTWQSKPIRNYVDTGSLSHVIGYVGEITREELKLLYNKGYAQGDIIGKAGIEKQYDEILRGKNGKIIKTVDVRERNISQKEGELTDPPISGKNLVLTIDRNIQTLTEKALGPRMGAAVVLKPASGEILAMVSYPWYDPNIFNRNDKGQLYQNLLADPNRPLVNRAIQSSYPPASTFKIIMTAAILNEKVFPLDKKVLCEGEIYYGDRSWRCWVRKPGHGYLNLQQALAQSCDIYYWNVVRDYLGIERVVQYARDFGLGELTNIDLPGETPGFVPTPQWKERRFHEKWLGGDTMNMSIGQGFTLITPLQMANMVAMLINNGVIYEPHLLKEVRDPISGAIVKKVQPTILHKSEEISEETFKATREYMRTVITEGTARFPLNIKTVQIAGKTGTAEVGLADRWHSWLVAYGPYNATNPEDQVVVAVIVEASNPWEWWATYATGIIFQGIFANQTYEEAVQALGFQHITTVRERRE